MNVILYGIADEVGTVLRDERVHARLSNRGWRNTPGTDFAKLDALFAETKRLMARDKAAGKYRPTAKAETNTAPAPEHRTQTRLIPNRRYGGFGFTSWEE